MDACYQCGCELAPDEVVHRDMPVGSIVLHGPSGLSQGTQYARKSLCIACARIYDEQQAKAFKIAGLVALGGFGAIFLMSCIGFAVIIGLFLFIWSRM
jgi:hypothetical protein